jgi:L-alanine-DL-glutamate epimerase-like enolase superfamily enzyme
VKITDVTVRRYSVSRDPREYMGDIQIVAVHTDAGVTGMGFVTAPSTTSDIAAALIRRTPKAAVALLREEATPEGIFLIPPDGPGLGLELDDAVAATSLVPE